MPSVTFYLNHDKTDKEGFVPIFMQFTDKGTRFRMYTGEKIPSPTNAPKKYWNIDKQRVSTKFIEANSINDVLDDLDDRVTTLYREEKVKGKIPTASKLKSLIEESTGSQTVKNDFVSLFNEYMTTSEGVKSLGTIKNYKTSLNYLKKFADAKNYPLDFDSIDSHFYDKFTSSLVNGGRVTNNTIGRIIKNLKSFLNWATDKKYNSNLEFKKFKVKREEKEVIYLTTEELYKVYELNLDDEELESIRDIFCFGCFTGLRISDIKQVSKDNVINNELQVRVQKTKDILKIPLLPEAQVILKKYDYELPQMNEQKVNRLIKLVCELAHLNETVLDIKYRGAKKIETKHPKYELITTHVARKTFVTLCLEKGVPPQVIMSITGHKDYKTMKPYIKVADKVKKDSLFNAWK